MQAYAYLKLSFEKLPSYNTYLLASLILKYFSINFKSYLNTGCFLKQNKIIRPLLLFLLAARSSPSAASYHRKIPDVYNNSLHLMSIIWGVGNPPVPFPSPISFSVRASCIFQSGSVRTAGSRRSPDSSGH